MFNIDIPYKSATPMKLMLAQKPGSKKLFYLYAFLDLARNAKQAPSTSLRMLKNYCILRPVLWMQ